MSIQSAPAQSAPAPPTSNTALISLIAGILGLTLLPLIGSIVAVITGGMARREIRDSAGAFGGEGMATAGLVLGWIGIGLSALGLCVFGALFAIPFCIALFAASSNVNSFIPAVLSVI
jgi:hypothetical protein